MFKISNPAEQRIVPYNLRGSPFREYSFSRMMMLGAGGAVSTVENPLTAGTATAGAYTMDSVAGTATDATGGTGPYTYQWERSTSSGSGFADVTGQTTTTLSDTTASPNTAYYYRLKYTDNAAASVYSNEITATTLAPALDLRPYSGSYADVARNYVAASTQSHTLSSGISALKDASTFTMAFWYKRGTTSNVVHIGQWESTPAFGQRTMFYPYSDGLVYVIVANGSNSYGSYSSNDTNWHHVVIVYSNAGATNADRLKVWEDGSQKTLTFTGTIPASPTRTYNGGEFGISKYGATYASFSLDSMGIWTDAKDSSFVARDYNSGLGRCYDGLGSDTNNLANYYCCNEETGTLFDSHGTSHIPVSSGANSPTWTTGIGAGQATDRNLARGFAAASSQRFTYASGITELKGVTTFTMAAWVKRSSASDTMAVGQFASNNRIGFLLFSDSNLYVYLENGAAMSSSAALAGTSWTHVALVYDGSQSGNANRLKLYINGVSTSLNYGAFTVPATTSSSATDFHIGYYALATTYSSGAADSLRIWSDAKDATFIEGIFNDGRALKYPSLTTAQKVNMVSAYDLEEAAGSNATDSHGSNTLTQSNSPASVNGVGYYEGIVSKVLDYSGNNSHAVMTTSTKRPAYVSSAINSLGGILLDGSDDALQVASIALSSSFTAFVVQKLTGTAGIVMEQSVNTASNNGFYIYGTTNSSVLMKRAAGTSSKNLSVNWAVDNATKILTYQCDGTNAGHTLRINGAAQTLSDVSAGAPGTSTVTDVLNIGARNGGASLPCNGYFTRIILFNSALTPTQIGYVESRLNSQFAAY